MFLYIRHYIPSAIASPITGYSPTTEFSSVSLSELSALFLSYVDITKTIVFILSLIFLLHILEPNAILA